MMLCLLHWKDENHKRWLFVATGYSEDKYSVIDTYNG